MRMYTCHIIIIRKVSSDSLQFIDMYISKIVYVLPYGISFISYIHTYTYTYTLHICNTYVLIVTSLINCLHYIYTYVCVNILISDSSSGYCGY